MLATTLLGILSFGSSSQQPVASRFPPVQISDETVRYAVTGQSVKTINAQLRQHALSFDQPEQGNTRSELELASTLEPIAGACQMSALSVELRVITTLPAWTPAAPVKAALREHVLDALGRLERHEAGHRVYAVSAAESLRTAVLALGSGVSCPQLKAAIDAQFQKAQWRLQFDGERYDLRTRHGERDDPRNLRRELSSMQIAE